MGRLALMPCRSELAREKRTGAAFIQATRVIVEVFASKLAPTGWQRLEMGEGQAQLVGGAVLFVLAVVASVAGIDEVRLVGEVLCLETDLQVLGQ